MKRVYNIKENNGKVKIPREFGMTTKYRNKTRKIKNLKVTLEFDLGEETELERTEDTILKKVSDGFVIIGVCIVNGFVRFMEKLTDYFDRLVR